MADRTTLSTSGSEAEPNISEVVGEGMWNYSLDADGARILDLSVIHVGERYVLHDAVYQSPVWVESMAHRADLIAREIVDTVRDNYNKTGKGTNPATIAKQINLRETKRRLNDAKT